MHKIVLLLSTLLLCVNIFSQDAQPKSSSELYLNLEKLTNTASVLYVGTRPEDINTQLLSYLSNERLLRTGYLSITRGESSKNYIADETGIDLGLIHTKESVAAGNVAGVETFYTRAYDFGTVTTANDAFKIWTKDKLLADVTNVIRQFQPDIIIVRYDSLSQGGENQATAQLIKEAFVLAADSSAIKHFFDAPWQAKRLLWNVTDDSTNAGSTFSLPVRQYNSLLGSSYYENAVNSRSYQKTAGTDYIYTKERPVEKLKLIAGNGFTNDILEGVDTSWQRFPNTEFVTKTVDSVISEYNFIHPELSTDKLARLYRLIQNLPGDSIHLKNYALTNVQNLVLDCAGITVKAIADQEFAVQGETCNVRFVVENRKKNNALLTNIRLNSFDTSLQNKDVDINKELETSLVEDVTQPYWLAGPVDEDYTYRVSDFLQVGHPENIPRYIAEFSFDINGNPFLVQSPVQYQYISKLQPIRTNDLSVISPVIVSQKPSVLLTNVSTISGKPVAADSLLKIQFKSNFNADSIQVSINIAQPSFKILRKDTVIGEKKGRNLYSFDTLMNVQAGDVYNIEVPVKSLSLEKNKITNGVIDALVGVRRNGITKGYSSNLRYLDYGYIAPATYNYTNHTAVIGNKIKTSDNTTVGYVNSSYDDFCEGLNKMGYQVKLLSVKNILSISLNKVDVVIIKNKANTQDSLYYKTLYNYVKQGGTLIVQLSRNDSVATPFTSMKLASSRLNAINSVIKMNAANRVFTYPNTVEQSDFANWRREYSNNQLFINDTRFKDLISVYQNNGSLAGSILADLPYGKGHIIYTGLTFGYQMSAGVESAYKQVANLVDYTQ